MTPLEIEILLHYHTRCNDYRDGDFSAPAVCDAINYFVDYGLLTPKAPPGRGKEATYFGTDALTVYAEALQAVPLPVRAWVIP